MVEYTQLRFDNPSMAKDLTEYSKPGGVLDGWELVCIHTGYPKERIPGISDFPSYIATFRRFAAKPRQPRPETRIKRASRRLRVTCSTN